MAPYFSLVVFYSLNLVTKTRLVLGYTVYTTRNTSLFMYFRSYKAFLSLSKHTNAASPTPKVPPERENTARPNNLNTYLSLAL